MLLDGREMTVRKRSMKQTKFYSLKKQKKRKRRKTNEKFRKMGNEKKKENQNSSIVVWNHQVPGID